MSAPPAPPTYGSGKAVAATAAGAIATIAVYTIDQVIGHPLPPEIVAAGQTLITLAAVYFTPHSFGGN